MNKKISYMLAVGLLGMTAATALNAAEAGAKKPGSEAAPAKEKKTQRLAFRGKLNTVDKTSMTITVEEKGKPRVIHITSHTRTTKAGKPATLGDAVIGEEVGGQVTKNAAGAEEAVSLRLAAKPEGKPSEKKAKKPEGEKAK